VVRPGRAGLLPVDLSTIDVAPTIRGIKYNDVNRDGVQDNGEPGLGGVRFTLVPQNMAFSGTTGHEQETTSAPDGSFEFAMNNEPPGSYLVEEQPASGYVNTTPLVQPVNVEAGAGDKVYDVAFGNRAEHPPVAVIQPVAPVDQSEPAGAPVALDGSQSYDPDNDPITSYTWTGPFGTVTGPTPTVVLPPGTTQVTLTVSDGILPGQASIPVTVYPPITAAPVPISATEGVSFAGPVATFTDPDPNGAAEEYAAVIDWGDGTPVGSGSIARQPDGTFTVTGGHTYAEEGHGSARVTITDTDTPFNQDSATPDFQVADAPLTAGAPVTVDAIEGNSVVAAAIGSFTDANPAAPAGDFTATIDWGDGTATSTGAVSRGQGGAFTVTGRHTYAEEGSYPTTIHVLDEGGSSTVLTGFSHVVDAALHATGKHLNSQNPIDAALATFTDANPGAPLSDFTATIDWGDGSQPTAGVVSGPARGVFTVSGTHSYATLGPKTIRIHIVDEGGSTADATARVLLYGLAAGGDFVIGDQNAALNSQVTYWGAQWWKDNTLSGGTAPAAFKGYENDPGASTSLTSWTTDPGDSSGPPVTVPSYLAVIVSSGITQTGSIIAGDAPHMVIVRTDPGYSNAPGHVGTGTVVANLR